MLKKMFQVFAVIAIVPALLLLSPRMLATAPMPAPLGISTVTLTPAGAVWKYKDDGSDQGTAWTSTAFDDSSWDSGPAQLGYGDGDEATTLGFGGDDANKHITTYFRRTFTVTNPSEIYGSLTLSLLRDDGAVVYLNGSEMARSNMPGGVISHTTQALVAVGGGDESTFFTFPVSASALVTGSNVLAVEIHQANPTSSDISFDLSLTAATFAGACASPDIRFAAIGDYGDEGQPLADVAALVKSWNPDFITTVGDNNYNLGEASTIDANIGQYFHAFIGNYTGDYGPGAASNNFYPAPGNHDWYFGIPGARFDEIRTKIVDALGLSQSNTPFPYAPEENEDIEAMLDREYSVLIDRVRRSRSPLNDRSLLTNVTHRDIRLRSRRHKHILRCTMVRVRSLIQQIHSVSY